MTNNAKIAAYFNIPYCEHDWSGVETAENTIEQMELTKCIHCPAYEDGIWDEPIDFETDSGFFVLLDAIREYDEGDTQVRIRQGKRDYFVEIDRLGECGEAVDTDIKTALIDATLEFIDREAK